jgi:glutamyl-tRNA synthetase
MLRTGFLPQSFHTIRIETIGVSWLEFSWVRRFQEYLPVRCFVTSTIRDQNITSVIGGNQYSDSPGPTGTTSVRFRAIGAICAIKKLAFSYLLPSNLGTTLNQRRCPHPLYSKVMLRVRFAPSPTGFLHVGSARTFIFNWLYARHNQGTMVLRLDDTDVERNTEASVNSIFEGLRWLDLGWDEDYKQSERLALHRQFADAIFQKGFAYRDFTPAHAGDTEKSGVGQTWLFNPGMRDLSREESDRRAAAGEHFALRFRVPRGTGEEVRFTDSVYGFQSKLADDIEDFALMRSDGMPTYHHASCVDDIDLRISHIIRGQDHLTNTFKHVLIFEAAGAKPPQFAHLPLLVAPDGSKLSKRRHGPVVSVTTYRDAGFLPEAFINFLCLLGWSPKDNRENMTRQELVEAFSLEGINRANAVVNFKEPAPTPDETFDPKALWLNAEHIRGLAVDELSSRLLPFVHEAGYKIAAEKMLAITPLIRERIKLLRDVLTAADFFFVDQLPPYDPAELIPQKGDSAMAAKVLNSAREVLPSIEFSHDPLDQALRAAAQQLGVKAGQMFQPIRVAVCGRKNAPPLFETLSVLGKDTVLNRIDAASKLLV